MTMHGALGRVCQLVLRKVRIPGSGMKSDAVSDNVCLASWGEQVMEHKGQEKRPLLRRDFLKQSGLVATGVGAGIVGLNLNARTEAQEQAQAPEWPWPYATLDVEDVRKRGHFYYYQGGCMYGSTSALLTALIDQVGYPYNLIPRDMMRYGSGGIAGWGSVCGSINGASAIITLTAGKEYAKLINELLAWYAEHPFPSDIANDYAKNHEFLVEEYKSDKVLPTSVSTSILCHVSVNTWCRTTGYASGSPERAERCGRLTGDVAAKTAELLNAYAVGKFVSTAFEKAECSNCHFMGENYEAGQFIIGKQRNCEDCHGDPHEKM
ncbi:hypothetical protein GF339_09570 [candidate division KSB3 bacterium]|uniref:Split soret cytochrome c n=1 Tax=candidate division KSB3 bacterium TaxID=2044937 RepID=A0A9D5JW64_9BACT|nr:hypothetical protein [candidate division KSB3 bacterium]MBD3324821.1 hypothetical protein [candidate division KSB3 bacterium]